MVRRVQTVSAFRLSHATRGGYKLPPDGEFMKASLRVLDAHVTLIISSVGAGLRRTEREHHEQADGIINISCFVFLGPFFWLRCFDRSGHPIAVLSGKKKRPRQSLNGPSTQRSSALAAL